MGTPTPNTVCTIEIGKSSTCHGTEFACHWLYPLASGILDFGKEVARSDWWILARLPDARQGAGVVVDFGTCGSGGIAVRALPP